MPIGAHFRFFDFYKGSILKMITPVAVLPVLLISGISIFRSKRNASQLELTP